MKYSIVTLLSIFLLGCKAQELSFDKAEMQKGVSGVQGGKSSYTFTLTTENKPNSIGKFTKLWYGYICYEINKQHISKDGRVTTVVLYTQDPPRGFRSSKSPIPLSDDITMVIEHSKKDIVTHIPIKTVQVEKAISYPSVPPQD